VEILNDIKRDQYKYLKVSVHTNNEINLLKTTKSAKLINDTAVLEDVVGVLG
jgi:hypothetical protein